MNQSQKKSTWKMNEQGFTITELLIGSAISLILLALVAGIVKSQSNTFSRQSQLGEMQANGRAAVDFISRSIQNAGFNVKRGKKFLAASDHYITMVFDDDNDGTIQNNEVMTYAVSNPDDTTSDPFTISPFFDDDGDGTVDGSETRDYAIALGLRTPPFHFYRITPDQGSSRVTKSTVARNIDNLIIRYWDKNGDPLPAGVETDVNGDPIPPYVIPAAELNDIRQLDVQIVVRSKDEDSNLNYLNSGSYLTGSAATLGGTTSYNDHYRRGTYSVVSSPRNLVTAPWGKVSLHANPASIVCPDSSTSITASVTDVDGEAISSGTTVNFNTSDGAIPATGSTDGNGETSVTLTYDWQQPSVTATVSANTLIDVDGEDHPVFNAIPVPFTSSGGIFTDNFSDGNSDDWTEEGEEWDAASGEYKTSTDGFALSFNGCKTWQDYETQVDIKRSGTNEYASLVVRYQDTGRYYSAALYSSGDPYFLKLEKYDTAGTPTLLGEAKPVPFEDEQYYTLKARIEENEFKAKFWKTSDPEPAIWQVEHEDTTYASGKIALTTTQSNTTFDNVAVNPIS